MADPIIPAPPAKALPLPLDGDLAIVFRNRDPNDNTQLLDYPAGVTGTLTIYADKKTEGAQRITKTVTPAGADCTIKIDAAVLNTVKTGTLWSFRLTYPDADLVDGYDLVATNGQIVRSDGTLS